MSLPLLTINNLALAYDGQRLIDGLCFTVSAGDYLCIVGENGSGKSTLLRGLLGLMTPAAGEITRADALSRGEIGYLPQQTKLQRDFPASVEEVVRSGCLNRRGRRLFAGAHERETVERNLARLGIADLRRRPYAELSGGQQQRVLLARALCASGTLLLLDEPVAGLDPLVSAELYRLIDGLRADGLTVIMVTHDLVPALASASHILHLGHGQHWFGTKEAYLTSPLGKHFAGAAET